MRYEREKKKQFNVIVPREHSFLFNTIRLIFDDDENDYFSGFYDYENDF